MCGRYPPVLLMLVLLLAGCGSTRYAPEAERAAADLGPPDGVALAPGQAHAWCAEPLSALQPLIALALRDSPQLGQAYARLREAEALARQAGATLWPSASVELAYARRRGAALAFGGTADSTVAGSGASAISDSYQVSVAAAYELDLWNRLGQQAAAARAEAEASRFDAEAAATSLAAQVAEGWAALVAQRQSEDLLGQQLEVARKLLRLTRLRFGVGQASGLDISQQRQQTEALQAQLALVGGERRAAAQRLAVLLGRAPSRLPPIQARRLPVPSPIPEAGIPADLLQRRPDLQAAYLRLAALDRRAAAAVAERLPAVRLTAELISQSQSPSRLLEQIFWSVFAQLGVTLFDGGRLEAAAEAAQARSEAQLYRYLETYLTALRELREALALEQARRDYLARLRDQREAAAQAFRLARRLYGRGAADYLRVLSSLQNLQEVQREEVQARRQLLSARVQFCRALGGDWQRRGEA